MTTKYLSIYRYIQDVSVNRAKKLWFPKIRGTWLPSFDIQTGRYKETFRSATRIEGITRTSGLAINQGYTLLPS